MCLDFLSFPLSHPGQTSVEFCCLLLPLKSEFVLQCPAARTLEMFGLSLFSFIPAWDFWSFRVLRRGGKKSGNDNKSFLFWVSILFYSPVVLTPGSWEELEGDSRCLGMSLEVLGQKAEVEQQHSKQRLRFLGRAELFPHFLLIFLISYLLLCQKSCRE